MAKKEQKEEDPMYKKICNSTKKCSVERKITDLIDMTAEICPQCYHIFSWEKKEVEKAEKPKKVKANVPEPEDVEIVSDADEKTSMKANDLKQAFAEVDDIMSEVEQMGKPKKEVKTEVSIEDELDPFEEAEEIEEKVKEGLFSIVGAKVKAEDVVRLICDNESGKKRFLVDVETDPKKVKMIGDKPALVVGKNVKVEYTRMDENDCPVSPKYITMVSK